LTRASGTSTAILAALALAGCGGSSATTPAQVGEQWYRATAVGNGKELCALSTAARQRRFVEIAKRIPGDATGASTCASAVDLTLKHFGGSARLSKLAHVHVRVVNKSKDAAEVQATGAAPLKLVRSGSGWLVAGAAAAAGGGSG
jgi:hypothetical protein